ncbi:hypothetical protein ABI214_00075 [Prescottella soli]|uniref:Uncharacterized protein n=1 Tax=Prescottella soli TaxID=1543852 RepID=A0ABW9G199_9NOCA
MKFTGGTTVRPRAAAIDESIGPPFEKRIAEMPLREFSVRALVAWAGTTRDAFYRRYADMTYAVDQIHAPMLFRAALPEHYASGTPPTAGELQESKRLLRALKSGNGDDEQVDRLSELAVAWAALNPMRIPLGKVDYER